MFGDYGIKLSRDKGCSAPGPYPEIKVIKPNTYYAQLLLMDYAGTVSELSAICQYVHHHLQFSSKYEDLADLEECIAITEMKHLEMLGETIKLLGVDPQYYSIEQNQKKYWDASVIFYGKDICDRLAADIAGEKAAINQYREHYKAIDDPYVKAILARIIKDEQYHVYPLYKWLHKYGCLTKE